MILPIYQRYKLAFCLSSSIHVIPIDVTTPRDSYAWNDRELATLLTLSESLAEVGLEPLTIGSMRNNLTNKSYSCMLSESLADGGFEPMTIGLMCEKLTTKSYPYTVFFKIQYPVRKFVSHGTLRIHWRHLTSYHRNEDGFGCGSMRRDERGPPTIHCQTD